MRRRVGLLLCVLLTLGPTRAWAQLGSVPNVFTSGTTISSASMNTNFSTVYANALNRTGGTMTGTLTTLAILPTTDNASDIGSAALSYNDGWFDGTLTVATLAVTTMSVTTLTCTGCVGPTQLAATAVSAAAYGSSTAIPTFTVDADGRLTAAGTVTPQLTFTSTYFSSLSLASGTGLPISTGVSGLGTGVATALAVNVGSSGAFTTWGSASTFGALTSTTLDTGQGANELFDMDQNVLTTSSPTFAALTVDNINIDLNTINATSGNLVLATTVGAVLVEDISVNAGVITGATSITSTAFVGALTGNVTGNVSGSAGSVPASGVTAGTFSGAFTFGALTVTTLNTYTFNQSVASGASPTFGAGNITGVLEANITDGTLLARLAANETVTGAWTFDTDITIGAVGGGNGITFIGPSSTNVLLTSATDNFYAYDTINARYAWRYVPSTGAFSTGGTLAWGGGSAISSSSNVALLNAANTFSSGLQTMVSLKVTGNASTGIGTYRLESNSINAQGGTSGFGWLKSDNSVYTMQLSDAGLLTVSGFGTHSFSAGGTGGNILRVRNTTAGTSNYATINVGNDASAVLAGLEAYSSTFTPVGYALANGVALIAGGVGGLSLAAESASGDIRLYSRNVLAATFGASQALTLTGAFNVPGLMSLTGTAANIALGSNYLSGDGGDEGISVDASGNGTISGTWKLTGNQLLGSNIMDSVGTPTNTSGGSAIAGRDYAFKYTHTSMGTPAVVGFGNTWSTTPVCTTTSDQTLYGTYISAVSTTSITIGFLNATAGSPTVYVHCRSY